MALAESRVKIFLLPIVQSLPARFIRNSIQIPNICVLKDETMVKGRSGSRREHRWILALVKTYIRRFLHLMSLHDPLFLIKTEQGCVFKALPSLNGQPLSSVVNR